MVSIAGGTAVASFIYEIGWIRMLSLVFGSATHSFELMLSAFILGLSFGSLWVSQYADRWRDPVRILGIVQWTMGACALATLPLYTVSFEWMAMLLQTFAKTELGYSAFSFARYGISLAIMLPSTFCAGITLPLITRILLSQGRGERAIGRVYGVNTLGSIGGVILAGLILLPWLGLKQLIIAGATLDMVLGVVILFAISESTLSLRRFAFGAAAATISFTTIGLLTDDFSPHLLASTVFRTGQVKAPAGQQIVYHHDGHTATVTATRESSGKIRIMTNGKPDASLQAYWFTPCTADQARHSLESDTATQALAALIPLAHMPQARAAAVIGFGSGLTMIWS
jgi:spermidine synthase